MKERKAYPTDLKDKEWAILEELLPKARTGRPRLHNVWYVLRTGCSWRMLPHDFPAWQTVYSYFRLLNRGGIWHHINDKLRERTRRSAGRETEPSTLIADSQSVKTTEKGALVAMMVVNALKDASDISW